MIILAQLKSNHIVNAQNYLLASSPALLGFLWAVTDADVDQWTVLFLQHWLSGKKDGQSELLQVCKLPMFMKYYVAFLRDFDALFLFLHRPLLTSELTSRTSSTELLWWFTVCP